MASLEVLYEINDHLREYLRHHNMQATLEAFEGEVRTRQMPKRLRNDPAPGREEPRLQLLFRPSERRTKLELSLERDLKELNKKYTAVLQGARQIFSVSINFIQGLMAHKEVIEREPVMDLLESYKIQLGKYHKVVINEGKSEGGELMGETVMQEHKQKLLRYWRESNVEALVEVLLSLRVNALQIAPELRKNLVYELIRNDVFNIEADNSFNVLTKILANDSPALRHAIISLVSVISATLRGVEYLTHNGNMVVLHAVIKILKQAENGSVIQRFCIAVLQKSSVKDATIPTMIEHGLIEWVIELLNESLTRKINIFCLDFSSALLANIVHSPHTILFLENNADIARRVLEALLGFMRSNLPVSVLMHVLIAISYLSKDNFAPILAEVKFVERISKFVEHYSQISTTDNEALEIDKKTVLDLCAHMFHPKDATLDNSESLDGMDLNSEDRIREYENEQGELIFECFQDEVS